MTDDINADTDDESIPNSVSADGQDEMTEQIEASFGPMTVYVSGTDAKDVQETFDHVWETMMDTSEKMREMKGDSDDDDERPTGRTFSD